ncbi:MAG: sialidase family protein [Legionella sp.]|nr:sialidase family protein [Legionella sp.]
MIVQPLRIVSLVVSTFVTLNTTLIYAQAQPKFSLIPTSSSIINIIQGNTTNITYKVTNNTRVTRTLALVPSSGISQISAGAGSCASPFTLAMGKSCFLNLQLNSKQLPASVNGGPQVCKTYGPGNNAPDPFLCSQPSAQNSLHITIVPSKPIMAAVGTYTDNTANHTIRPLLAMTQDNGANWTFPSSITQPTLTPAFNNNGGGLSAVSCTGALCVAVGGYSDSPSDTQHPLLALTQDNGSSWKFPASITQPTLTPAFANGSLSSTSCSGLICIAVGDYTDLNSNSHPLLFLSQDGGSNWSSPASIAQPVITPAYNSAGVLQSASCSGTVCIAVGKYIDINIQQEPLLALSQNSGTTWTYPTATTQPTVTPAYNGAGTYNSASCNGNTCIAGGQYNGGSILQPMIAVSQNKGSTWNFPASITEPVLTPAYGNGGIFNTVSCSATTCIAGGDYNDATRLLRPMLALSQDKGITWTYPTVFTSPVLTPAFAGNGSINSVSCSGDTCLAVGSYSDTSFTAIHPLLAVSQDRGTTWTFPAAVSQPTLTPAFSSGALISASCNKNICLASGSYADAAGQSRPLIAQSIDNGVTWTFPTSITQPVLKPSLGPVVDFGGVSANASFLSPALSMLQQN